MLQQWRSSLESYFKDEQLVMRGQVLHQHLTYRVALGLEVVKKLLKIRGGSSHLLVKDSYPLLRVLFQ